MQWEGATRKSLLLGAYSPGVPLAYMENVQRLMPAISTKGRLGTCSDMVFPPLLSANNIKKCTYLLQLMICDFQGTDFGWTLA